MYRYYNDFFDSKNYCDETVYAFYLELCQRGGRVAPLLIEVVTGDYISDNIHVPSNDFQVCLLTPWTAAPPFFANRWTPLPSHQSKFKINYQNSTHLYILKQTSTLFTWTGPSDSRVLLANDDASAMLQVLGLKKSFLIFFPPRSVRMRCPLSIKYIQITIQYSYYFH